VLCPGNTQVFSVFYVQAGIEMPVSATFESSDNSIVQIVPANGNATAVGRGNVTIKARPTGAPSAELTASVQVTGGDCCNGMPVWIFFAVDASKSMLDSPFGGAYRTRFDRALASIKEQARDFLLPHHKIFADIWLFDEAATQAATGLETPEAVAAAVDTIAAQPRERKRTSFNSLITIAQEAAKKLSWSNWPSQNMPPNWQPTGRPTVVVIVYTDGEDTLLNASEKSALQSQLGAIRSQGVHFIVMGLRANAGFEFSRSLASNGAFTNAYPGRDGDPDADITYYRDLICASNCMDSEEGYRPVPALNYVTFREWEVRSGIFDLYGRGLVDPLPHSAQGPYGEGVYVHFSPVTQDGAVLRSLNAIAYKAGDTYTVKFYAAGNQRLGVNQGLGVRVIDELGVERAARVFAFGWDSKPREYSFNFVPDADFNGKIEFYVAGTVGTLFGPLLYWVSILRSTGGGTPSQIFRSDLTMENVRFVQRGCGAANSVMPLPAPWPPRAAPGQIPTLPNGSTAPPLPEEEHRIYAASFVTDEGETELVVMHCDSDEPRAGLDCTGCRVCDVNGGHYKYVVITHVGQPAVVTVKLPDDDVKRARIRKVRIWRAPPGILFYNVYPWADRDIFWVLTEINGPFTGSQVVHYDYVHDDRFEDVAFPTTPALKNTTGRMLDYYGYSYFSADPCCDYEFATVMLPTGQSGTPTDCYVVALRPDGSPFLPYRFMRTSEWFGFPDTWVPVDENTGQPMPIANAPWIIQLDESGWGLGHKAWILFRNPPQSIGICVDGYILDCENDSCIVHSCGALNTEFPVPTGIYHATPIATKGPCNGIDGTVQVVPFNPVGYSLYHFVTLKDLCPDCPADPPPSPVPDPQALPDIEAGSGPPQTVYYGTATACKTCDEGLGSTGYALTNDAQIDLRFEAGNIAADIVQSGGDRYLRVVLQWQASLSQPHPSGTGTLPVWVKSVELVSDGDAAQIVPGPHEPLDRLVLRDLDISISQKPLPDANDPSSTWDKITGLNESTFLLVSQTTGTGGKRAAVVGSYVPSDGSTLAPKTTFDAAYKICRTLTIKSVATLKLHPTECRKAEGVEDSALIWLTPGCSFGGIDFSRVRFRVNYQVYNSPTARLCETAQATSPVSQADAVNKATQAAQGSLATKLAPRCHRIYTSTQEYTAFCDSSMVGDPVTKSATGYSLVSFQDAVNDAKTLARALAESELRCYGEVKVGEFTGNLNDADVYDGAFSLRPDNYPLIIPWPNAGRVSSLTLTLKLERMAYLPFLYVTLVSPDGKNACALMSGVGLDNSYISGKFLTFSDSAADYAPRPGCGASFPFTGSYKPTPGKTGDWCAGLVFDAVRHDPHDSNVSIQKKEVTLFGAFYGVQARGPWRLYAKFIGQYEPTAYGTPKITFYSINITTS
jgi:hypothetical protein